MKSNNLQADLSAEASADRSMSVLQFLVGIVSRVVNWLTIAIQRRRQAAKHDGLQIVSVGGGVYAYLLDPSTKEQIQKVLELPKHDQAAIGALTEQDARGREAFNQSAFQSDIESCVRQETAKGMRTAIRSMLATLLAARRDVTRNNHAPFPRIRWEFVFSWAGVVCLAMLLTLLGVIGGMGYADFQVASETVKQSSLFDRANLVDPNAPMEDPSSDFIAAFCFVPVCLLTLAIKTWLHPPAFCVQSRGFKFLSVVTCCLALLSTIGFAWIVGGHESLIANAVAETSATTIAGIKLTSNTPPFEYVALLMVALGCGAAVFSCYIPACVRPFFDNKRALDVPHNHKRLARIDSAIATTRGTLSIVDGVLLHFDAQRTQLGFSTEGAIKAANNSEAEMLRRRLRQLGSAVVMGLLPALAGCGEDVPEPAQHLRSSAVAAVATPQDGRTVQAHVFVSDATNSDKIVPLLDQWLISQLPGGSRVSLYEGEKHRHVIDIDVAHGPPQTRVRNPRFQTSYIQLEKYLSSRKVGPSDQVAWPMVAETIAGRGPTKQDVSWVLLCGNPLYIAGDDPVFSFRDDTVASHGLLGKPATPFAADIALPPNTLVRWWASTSRWGDSREQRQETILFQRCYWHAISGYLTDITPDAHAAFSFTPPFSLTPSPERRDEPPMMLKAPVPPELDETLEKPDPVRIAKGFRRTSMATPGSIAYRIEMAGGNLSELRGESLVIQIYIDRSGSMEARINGLVTTILRLAEDLPPLVKSLEIGCTAASDQSRTLFPIQTIRSKGADGGRSIQALEGFLRSIVAEHGDYSTTAAIKENVRILDASGAGKRKFFLFLSDIVSVSDDGSGQQKQMDQVVAGIRRWTARADTDNRVIALFSGSDSGHMSFINRMVSTHPNGVVSRDPDVLIEQVIAAALPEVAESLLETPHVPSNHARPAGTQ